MNRVATENSRRNPQRTASTAAALMIGLALVTLVATLAAGITSTFRGAVNDIFTSDYAITAQNNFSPIPTDAAEAAAKAPGVEAIASTRTGEARVFGKMEFVTAVDAGGGPGADPEVDGRLAADALHPRSGRRLRGRRLRQGPQPARRLADHRSGSVGEEAAAEGEGHLRSARRRLPVRARHVLEPRPSTATTSRRRTSTRSSRCAAAITTQNTQALESALKDFPNAKAQTREEFIDNQISGLKSILNILYVLLALSVIVSLFGIVNTLVLTVFERTRELGMLRAIGMTRRQVRRMIRHESVITALIGGALGIVLGIALGALLIARVDFIEFALPTMQIIVFAIAAIIVGILAAIFPARRAAKLDPLEALQYE